MDVKLFALPAVAMTTKAKIAGATYGFQIVPIYLNQRLDLAAQGFANSDGLWFRRPVRSADQPGLADAAGRLLSWVRVLCPDGKRRSQPRHVGA